MARKENPTVVGEIECPTCKVVAEVRQRSNGRGLLYTYCPNCKMDQRSGDAIQAHWRETMKPVGTLANASAQTEAAAVQAVDKGTGSSDDEWTPDNAGTGGQPAQRQDEDDDGGSGLFWGLALFTGIGLGIAKMAKVF